MSQRAYDKTDITSLSKRATSVAETGQGEQSTPILDPAVSLPDRRWWSRHRPLLIRLSKFMLVGGTGVLVNNLALLILFQWVHLPLLVASVLASELAIINNFYWNDRWTFKRTRISLSRFARFNLVSLSGLLITTGTLWVLVTHLGLNYLLANLLGISLAMVWNFVVNSLWTWGGVK
jgi:putative flippase GtrA